MENIWSENKYVNITINVLLFLLGINFMHYGQFTLPIICFILFIDRKLRFHVNNVKTFIILCLFAISFFAFSYKQGFYSVMGFCLPMVYYIGSNIYKTNENKIINIIYIIVFGMILHVLLNFAYDISLNGFHLFYSSSHYDIWIQGKTSATANTINYIFLIGSMYYIINYEKNKYIKILGILLFMTSFVYCVGLGERTTLLMIVISFFASFVIDFYINKDKKMFKKLFAILVIFVLFCVAAFIVMYFINSINPYNSIFNIRIINKFLEKGLSSERINVLLQTIKLSPYHLFGGNVISETLGIMPHDLWSDVYDWGGVITFVLLIIHTIMFAITFMHLIKNKKISKEFKILIIPLFICIALQMMLEPIMSGASIFLICVILVESLLENLNNYES